MVYSMPVKHLNQDAVSGDDSPLTVDYKLGDVVVYREFYLDQLHVVDALHEDGSIGITGFKKREGWLKAWVDKKAIRPATKAEKKARKRLS